MPQAQMCFVTRRAENVLIDEQHVQIGDGVERIVRLRSAKSEHAEVVVERKVCLSSERRPVPNSLDPGETGTLQKGAEIPLRHQALPEPAMRKHRSIGGPCRL